MLYLKDRMPNGMVLVVDTADGRAFAIGAADYLNVQQLPEGEQRATVEALVEQRQADPNPRTELEQTMAENASQGQGERQQDEGRGR